MNCEQKYYNCTSIEIENLVEPHINWYDISTLCMLLNYVILLSSSL